MSWIITDLYKHGSPLFSGSYSRVLTNHSVPAIPETGVRYKNLTLGRDGLASWSQWAKSETWIRGDLFFFIPFSLNTKLWGEAWTKLDQNPTSLHLLDGALGRPEVHRAGRRHVEGLGFAIEARTLGGHAQAALAGGDDLRYELFAVYADLHGDPVLGELLGQVRLVLWLTIFTAVLRKPEDGDKSWTTRMTNRGIWTAFCALFRRNRSSSDTYLILLRRLCRLCPDPNGFFSGSAEADAPPASSLAAATGPNE